jgi:hypothetical protein
MRRFWTEAERAVLRRDYPHLSAGELAARLGRSQRSVYREAAALGLRKNRTYLEALSARRRANGVGRGSRFRQGHRPWNTGLQGYDAGGRSAATRFQKGQLPWNHQPIGAERIPSDGYRQRKVTDTRCTRRDWVGVHVLVYREQHGEVPPDHIVIFIDGDKTHIAPQNLTAVSRAELVWLNKRGYNRLPPELRPSAIALARLVEQRRRRANRRPPPRDTRPEATEEERDTPGASGPTGAIPAR